MFHNMGSSLIVCVLDFDFKVAMSSPATQFVCPWPCLVASTPKSVSTRSFAQATVASPSKVSKTFSQALSNSCNILVSQLPKPCLKGEKISIKISEDHYSTGVLDCQNVLYGRFTLPKGSTPVRMLDLKARIFKFWKTNAPWSMASLGALGNPLTLDEMTKKRTFGHFARVLIEVDSNSHLHDIIFVERNDFDFYANVEYENLCNLCQIIGHSVKNCKFQIPKASTSVLKHKMQHVAKPNTSSSEVEKVDEVLTLHTESTPNNTEGCSKVVEEDPLITDIIRSKETSIILSMRDVFLLEESYEEVVEDSLPLRYLGKSIVVTDPNLSNFIANVIHEMQVLGIISAPTASQKAMNFLSDSWANMSQNEEINDLADHQFQLVVPRKKEVKAGD
uniref:IMP dehydrogenase/GMP reductase, related n=1 Tax=Medicago truncatula TaxID=3880 RepID=Q2HS16_MEDTR|nr:IMP dehydrogenase/GMP reductase, related [Medicago truncatula]